MVSFVTQVAVLGCWRPIKAPKKEKKIAPAIAIKTEETETFEVRFDHCMVLVGLESEASSPVDTGSYLPGSLVLNDGNKPMIAYKE